MQVLMVGDGPLAGALRASAGGLPVHFAGFLNQSEITSAYAVSDALLLPSDHGETWGLVVNEALSHGCPSIVSNICGCVPELIRDGVTGYVFQANSVSGLAKRMLSAVATFKNIEETANNCISHMRSFSPENAAQQILEGCESILRRSKNKKV